MFTLKRIYLLVVVVMLGQTSIATAQTANENEVAVTNSLIEYVESFFDNLKDPTIDTEAAFSDLLANGPLADQPEQLVAFVESHEKLKTTYRRFLVAKPISSKRVGDDLTFLTFLYETERFPIVWRFVFYRPPLESVEQTEWFVVRLSFDTKLEQLLDAP